jgi:hypothetical protein
VLPDENACITKHFPLFCKKRNGLELVFKLFPWKLDIGRKLDVLQSNSAYDKNKS